MRLCSGLSVAARRSCRAVVGVACALLLLVVSNLRVAAHAQQVAQVAYTQGTTIATPSSTENAPTTIAVDGSGNLYSTIGTTLYKATQSGGTYTFASTGITVAGGSYIAVDANGIIYVASSVDSQKSTPYLTRYTPSGSSYTSTALLSGYNYVELGLAVDPAGNAFVVSLVPDGSTGPVVQEVFAGTTNSSNLVTLTSSSDVSAFTVDSNDNLFFDYEDRGALLTEIPRVNGSYSANSAVTFSALCSRSTPCDILALAADTGGDVYSVYFVDDSSSSGAERYLPAGSTFSAGLVFTGSQSPSGIAVGPTGIVYTIDGTSNNIVTHLPPQVLNFGTVSTAGHDPASQEGTVTFVLDASTVYKGVTYVEQGGGSSFSQSGGASCGTSQCASGTTYPAETVVSVPSSFLSYTVGSHYGSLELNSTSGTIATAFLTGTVTAPNLTFLPAVASSVTQAANSTPLRTPAAVATDEAGNAYVVDTGTQSLVKVVPSSGQTTTLATGLNVTSATAAAPALDAAGNVYFVQADPAHSGLFEVTRLNTLDGGSTYPTTSVVQASLTSPQGIAVDLSGDVFVLDGSTNQVSEYTNINGSYLPRTVISNLSNVKGLAVGSDSSLYIATTSGLLKSTPASGVYGTPVTITPSADTAYSVALDSIGNIYVNDAGNDRVLRLSPDASVVTTLYTSSNATVSGIAATPAGNVLLAEGSTSTLGLLTLSNPPSLTFATTAVGSVSADSPQTITFFNSGNAALAPNSDGGSGSSTITAPFSLGSGSTCVQAFAGSGTVVLAQNASCVYLVSFTPTASGAVTGSLQTKAASGYGYQLPTETDVLSGTGALATPTVQVNSSSFPYGTVATTYTLTATVSYTGSTAPTGAVTFTVGTSPQTTGQATCNTTSSGVLTCTATLGTTYPQAGTYPITVTEAADGNYQAASGTGTLTVTKVTPPIYASAPSSTYGAATLALSAQISYAQGTARPPSGVVTFTVDGTNTVTAFCTTLQSSVSCTANYSAASLAVGQHTVSATVASDTNYNSNTSANGNFTVNPGTPTATVPSSTVAYGSSSIQLTATFGFTGAAPPSGAVTLTINNATYNATCGGGTASPRSCSITYNPSALAAGSYTVTSNEAADGNYTTATANGTLTVSTSAPSVSVPPVSAVYGSASTTLSANFTYTGSTAPSGQVTFTVNNGAPTQANCSNNGSPRICSASYALGNLGGGSYTFQATEAADSNFGVATAQGTLTVTPAAPSVTPSAATAVYGSSSVQLNASVAYTGSAGPTGQLTFTVNGNTLVPATCTGSASPRTCTGTFNPAGLGAGQYSLTLAEASDTNYSSATSSSTTLTLTKATPTIVVNNASASYGAASTTLVATVSYSGSTPPSGQFAFSIDGGAAVQAACSGSSPTLTCTASVPTSALAVGSHTITATQAASANDNAISGSATLTVSQGTTTLSVAPVTGSAGGSAVTLTAAQTFSSTAPMGLVSFQVNGTAVAATCIGSTSPRNCTASFNVAQLPSGTYNYSASSAADSSYIATTSNTSTLTLSSSSVTLTAQSATSTYGVTPLPLAATLAYTGGSAPTGTVSLLVDGTTRVSAICIGTASPLSCTGSYTGAALTAGTHTLSATFSGDTTYGAASSGAAPITINPAALTATVSPSSTTYGAATASLTAAIPFSGPAAPTGSVRFQVNGGTPVTAFCNAGTGSLQCSANYPSSSLAVGQYPVVATVAADSNYTAATSAAGTLTVNKATPVLSLAAVIAPYGATSVNLVATFSNLQAVPPSGAVAFLVDGTATTAPSCSFAGATGTCTVAYNASALAVGAHTLVVTLAADANYNQANATTTLNVTRGALQITAPAVSVPSGSSSATLNAAIAYAGAAVPSGAVTFTLAGSNPLAATCSGTSSPLNCAASISLTSVPAGAYTLTAAIAADTNYAAAAATTTLTVSPGAASTFPTCTLGSIKSVSSTSNAVSVTATCTDPANLALNTTLNWGDGTPVVPAANNGVNTHTYASPPVQTTYTVVLTGTNTAGSAGTAVQAVTVVPIVTVATTGSASVSTTVAAQPPSVPVLQVTFLCTSVSTSISGQSVTNALPSSYGITCSSPSVSSTTSGSAQVTISTTPTTTAMLLRGHRSMLVEALLLPFLGLPFVALAGAKHRVRLLSLVLATAAVCLTLSGCGGSFNAPATATPKGTYYITITEVTAAGTTPPTGFVQTSLIVPLTVQ